MKSIRCIAFTRLLGACSGGGGKGADGCLGHGEDLSDQLLPKKVEVWAPGQ